MRQVLLLTTLFVFGGIHMTEARADGDVIPVTDEFADLNKPSPFKKEVKPVDPSTHEKVDRIILGPAMKSKKGDIDYYRYVTFYNVDTRKERVYSLPVHREGCTDKGELWASYTYTYTRSVNVKVGVDISGLGLSADITDTQTRSTSHNVTATGEAIADHVPYVYKEDWEGLTYLQTHNRVTGQEEIVLKQNDRTPFWLTILFPVLSTAREYPMEFAIKNAAWTFSVEREVVAPCGRRK